MTAQQTSMKSMLREGAAIAVRFAKARTGSFFLAVLGAALFVAAIVASAVVIGRVTDELIVPVLDQGSDYEAILWPAIWAVIGVALWKAAAIVLRRTAAGFLQFRVQADSRHDLIDHLLKLELAWYQRQSTGTLLAVSDTDVRQGTFILAPLPYGIGSLLLLVGTVVLIVLIDGWLAVTAFVCLAAIVAVNMNAIFFSANFDPCASQFVNAGTHMLWITIDQGYVAMGQGRGNHKGARFDTIRNNPHRYRL